MFEVHLIVRPRQGVRDPQGEAVEESLRGVGFGGIKVECVGRYLVMRIRTETADSARKLADDMCRRLLVNPSLETYELEVKPV